MAEPVVYEDSPLAQYMGEHNLQEHAEPAKCPEESLPSRHTALPRWSALGLAAAVTAAVVAKQDGKRACIAISLAAASVVATRLLISGYVRGQTRKLLQELDQLAALCKTAILRLQEVEVVSRGYSVGGSVSLLEAKSKSVRLNRLRGTTASALCAVGTRLSTTLSLGMDFRQTETDTSTAMLKELHQVVSLLQYWYGEHLQTGNRGIAELRNTRAVVAYWTLQVQTAVQDQAEPVKVPSTAPGRSQPKHKCLQQLSLLEHSLRTAQIKVGLLMDDLSCAGDTENAAQLARPQWTAMFDDMTHIQELMHTSKATLESCCDVVHVTLEPQEEQPLREPAQEHQISDVLFDATRQDMNYDDIKDSDSWIIEGYVEAKARATAQRSADRLSTQMLMSELKTVVAAREFA
ncbi:hypothetical protein RI367_000154 [Sorochytrium milnesiophthora]